MLQTLPNKRTEAMLATAEDILWLLLETTKFGSLHNHVSEAEGCYFLLLFLLCLHSAQTTPG